MAEIQVLCACLERAYVTHLAECTECAKGTYLYTEQICPALATAKERILSSYRGSAEDAANDVVGTILFHATGTPVSLQAGNADFKFGIVRLLIDDISILRLNKGHCGEELFERVLSLLHVRDNSNVCELWIRRLNTGDIPLLIDLLMYIKKLRRIRFESTRIDSEIYEQIGKCCKFLVNVEISGIDVEDVPESGIHPLLWGSHGLPLLQEIKYQLVGDTLIWRPERVVNSLHYQEEFICHFRMEVTEAHVKELHDDLVARSIKINRVELTMPQKGAIERTFDEFKYMEGLDLTISDQDCLKELLKQHSERLRLLVIHFSGFSLFASRIFAHFPELTQVAVKVRNFSHGKVKIGASDVSPKLITLDVDNYHNITIADILNQAPSLKKLHVKYSRCRYEELEELLEKTNTLLCFSAEDLPKIAEVRQIDLVDKHDKVTFIGNYNGNVKKSPRIQNRLLFVAEQRSGGEGVSPAPVRGRHTKPAAPQPPATAPPLLPTAPSTTDPISDAAEASQVTENEISSEDTAGLTVSHEPNGMSVEKADASAPSLTCVICLSEPANRLFIPCGHLATCRECCSSLMKKRTVHCPICMRLVKSYNEVFFP